MGFNSYANSNSIQTAMKYSVDNASEVLFEVQGKEFPDEWIWHAYRGGSDWIKSKILM